MGGRRDVRVPGACVVEQPSGRGVLAEHSISGGASAVAAAATQHGCAALAEEASRRACSCDMMGSALLRTRVQRRKSEREEERRRDSRLQIKFSQDCVKTQNVLNTTVVDIFKNFNFGFSQNFI